MAELALAKSGADKARQLATLFARHFKIESNCKDLIAAVRGSDSGEIRTQTEALNAVIIEQIRKAWELGPEDNPWLEALRRGDKLQAWSLIEWILRNCNTDPETSWLFELKVDAAELLDLLTEYPNSRSRDLQQRLRKALSDDHAEILQQLIEQGLEAIDDSFGDDDGSIGRPVKPPSPPPTAGFREPRLRRNEDVEGR